MRGIVKDLDELVKQSVLKTNERKVIQKWFEIANIRVIGGSSYQEFTVIPLTLIDEKIPQVFRKQCASKTRCVDKAKLSITTLQCLTLTTPFTLVQQNIEKDQNLIYFLRDTFDVVILASDIVYLFDKHYCLATWWMMRRKAWSPYSRKSRKAACNSILQSSVGHAPDAASIGNYAKK